MDSSSILTIVVVVIVVLFVLWLLQGGRRRGGDRRHDGDRRHRRGVDWDHNSEGNTEIHIHKDGCCQNEDVEPPTDVRCRSNDLFTVNVHWKAADCDVDHYNVYVKYLDHCRQHSPNHSMKSSQNAVQGRRHSHRRRCKRTPDCDCGGCKKKCKRTPDCGCDPCKKKRRPKGACGPHNFDKVIKVPGNQKKLKLKPVKSKGVCVSVTAVNKCGKESAACDSCKCCVNCAAKVDPCIVESDCRGLAIKWEPLECAEKYKIYYNDDLLVELPGDAGGATGLPPIEESQPYGCENELCPVPDIYVQVCTPCGEGPKVKVEKNCEDCD